MISIQPLYKWDSEESHLYSGCIVIATYIYSEIKMEVFTVWVDYGLYMMQLFLVLAHDALSFQNN